MRDTLSTSIKVTHSILGARLDRAESSVPTRDRPRDMFPATDTFLASTSRHIGAVNAVLVPEVRHHLPDGAEAAAELVRLSKRLEDAMFQTKSKLYGSTYAIRRPWASIWADVHERFDDLLRLEEELAARLVTETDEELRAGITERIYRAELTAPTRPHPHLPHQGLRGRIARRVALGVDRFWDQAEGRMIPEPVRVHDHQRDGRLTQYLLAQSRLPED
ncbi:MAG TPA: hypothetical protein VNS55_06330 [Nocardioides sp.]|nr:hypothetical protein [Nocardioides sp.]